MQDRQFICPCYRHEQDIAETGHCLCSLFVAADYTPEAEDEDLLTEQGDWPRIVVYGTVWCRDTRRTRRFLRRRSVPYIYVDVEEDPEAALRVMAWTDGMLSTPMVEVEGRVLREPSDEELGNALGIEE